MKALLFLLFTRVVRKNGNISFETCDSVILISFHITMIPIFFLSTPFSRFLKTFIFFPNLGILKLYISSNVYEKLEIPSFVYV